MLAGWLREMESIALDAPNLSIEDGLITVHFDSVEKVRFFENRADYEAAERIASITDACIETKKYRKQFTKTERAVFKYLGGNKARFYCD